MQEKLEKGKFYIFMKAPHMCPSVEPLLQTINCFYIWQFFAWLGLIRHAPINFEIIFNNSIWQQYWPEPIFFTLSKFNKVKFCHMTRVFFSQYDMAKVKNWVVQLGKTSSYLRSKAKWHRFESRWPCLMEIVRMWVTYYCLEIFKSLSQYASMRLIFSNLTY